MPNTTTELDIDPAVKPAIFEWLNREIYDTSDTVEYSEMALPGINETVVRQIWTANKEPDWMLDLRLKSLAIYESKTIPTWGPDLSALDMSSIYYYAKPAGASDAKSWDDVPEAIKNTFEKLGIPEAERQMLAGVGAQYDSEVVYHSLKQELVDQGVIFEDMSVAIHRHEALVKSHFMRAVPATDHIFAALHGAVWSGGTFLFVPKGVVISEPLQAYFRMNAKSGGQFEHTLIILEEGAEAHYIEGCSAPKYGVSSLHAGCVEIYVWERAKMRYSSVENWSIDTYNLNTKRAIVEAGGFIEWVGGNLGSGVTMLYPCSILKWAGSKARHIGVAFANAGQIADTGAKVIHIGADTSSEVISKSLSKAGGVSNYRGLIDIKPGAHRAVSQVVCDGLILDTLSSSDTIPDIRVTNTSAIVAQEASVGKISEESLAYLTGRGLTVDAAKQMIVNGFLAPIMSELPLEYAVEMNILIGMELEWGH
jgi:Fe-S cluster assembly protein SufB